MLIASFRKLLSAAIISLSIFAAVNTTLLRYRIACLLSLTAWTPSAFTQSDYKVACVGFYNLENLFHPSDDPDLDDAEFTPEGVNRYSYDVYREKLDHLAEVIGQLGTEVTPDGVAILGVSEVENRKVLEDLITHPILQSRDYRIIHYDSRDHRGIDVALLYRQDYFQYDSSTVIPLITGISESGDTSYSRDILLVHGTMDGERITISVNHWPSRRGGEKATAPLRNKAAGLNKTIVDRNTMSGVKTIVMGDLNDDPVNTSVRKILRARTTADMLLHDEMYNPMYPFYKRGMGTTAYQDAWSLFDQIIVSSNLTGEQEGFRFYKARVFNEPFLTQKLGQYKGYPFRTYAGNTYLGGYSDHFPVYVFLVKRI